MNKKSVNAPFKLDLAGLELQEKRHQGRSSDEAYLGLSVYAAGDIAISFSREAMEDLGWVIHDQIRMGLQDGHLILVRVKDKGWRITPKSKGAKQNPELIGTACSGILRRPLLVGMKRFSLTQYTKTQIFKQQGALCIPLPSEALENE